MGCIDCGQEKRIAAKGLCSACYWRQHYGSGKRIYGTNKHKTCSDHGCREVAIAKGFCRKHYQQKAQHPLNSVWKLVRSRAKPGRYPAAWDDFEAFLKDVGDRPSPQHQLRRIDSAQPYSKENLHWLAPLAGRRHTLDDEARSTYIKGWHLRKYFKMGAADYDAMLKKQDGACAICKQPERTLIKRTGKIKGLSVDHCHGSGKVRGLLCTACNYGVGAFKDDPALLRRAIVYLEG